MNITKEFFANYKYLNSMIKSMERRLRYFEKHPLVALHGVVKGSMTSFPYAECHFVVSGANVKSTAQREKEIKQLLMDLEGNRQLYSDMKLDIERFIFESPVLSLEEQTIFRLKYIDGWSLEKIGEELGYDKSAISRKIDSVLDRIDYTYSQKEVSTLLTNDK